MNCSENLKKNRKLAADADNPRTWKNDICGCALSADVNLRCMRSADAGIPRMQISNIRTSPESSADVTYSWLCHVGGRGCWKWKMSSDCRGVDVL